MGRVRRTGRRRSLVLLLVLVLLCRRLLRGRGRLVLLLLLLLLLLLAARSRRRPTLGRGERHANARYSLELRGSEHHPLRALQGRPLSLLSVLQELDEPNGHGEFRPVERVRRGLVGHGPDGLERLHGQSGRREEPHGLLAADIPRPLRVGGGEQSLVVRLSVILVIQFYYLNREGFLRPNAGSERKGRNEASERRVANEKDKRDTTGAIRRVGDRRSSGGERKPMRGKRRASDERKKDPHAERTANATKQQPK